MKSILLFLLLSGTPSVTEDADLTTPKDYVIIQIYECDTAQMGPWFIECMIYIDGITDQQSRDYYEADCKRQSKELFCKYNRYVIYYRKDIEIKRVSCDNINSLNSRERELCNFSLYDLNEK